jgi:outer membrane immunogenic protein
MNKILFATTCLCIVSGSALAADVAAFTWTGGYVGAQAGHVWGDGSFGGIDDHANPQPAGFFGGVYAGANYQFGNDVVVGIEADMAWSGADDSALVYNSAGIAWPADYPVIQEINRTGAVRARLGYAVGRWLPYVVGGVAFAAVDQRLVGADGNFNTTYTGWTLGLGTEYAFSDNVIFRAEYRYADLGSKTFDVQDAPPLVIGLKTSDVRMGVAYKF